MTLSTTSLIHQNIHQANGKTLRSPKNCVQEFRGEHTTLSSLSQNNMLESDPTPKSSAGPLGK